MKNLVLSFMKNSMFGTSKNNEIFNPIVVPNAVNMVNYFRSLKVPTKFLFHLKTASFNIFSVVVRVCGVVNKNVTSFINHAALPTGGFISNHKFPIYFLVVSPFITFVFSYTHKLFTTTADTNLFYIPRFSKFSVMSGKQVKFISFLKRHKHILLQGGLYGNS